MNRGFERLPIEGVSRSGAHGFGSKRFADRRSQLVFPTGREHNSSLRLANPFTPARRADAACWTDCNTIAMESPGYE